MTIQDLIDFHTTGAAACEAFAVTPAAGDAKYKDIAKHYTKRAKWHRDAVALLSAQHQGEPVAFIQIPKNIEKYGHGDQADRLSFGKPGQFFVNGESPMFDFVLLYTEQPAPVAVVMPERDLSAELVEMMNAPNYFENVSEVDRSKWFKWDWSEHKSRPINKFYLCDVVLADGRVLFNQSPHDFDWSGDEVAAARQGCSLEAARLNGVKP